MNDFKGKVVVVTGGSAGFGAVLADEFTVRGADVVIIGRNQERLDEAARDALGDFTTVVCDVCRDADVSAAIASIVDQKGRIDVWVNNVGMSTRVSLGSSTMGEYEQLMQTNFFSAVRCSLAVLGEIEKSSGTIVNIGSLAAKTAWPLMGPYCASKHALAAFTHQLRLESSAGVHSLFVCCGPIRREDSETRYAKQAEQLGEAAGKPGGGVKLKGLDPQKLAFKIVAAVSRRKKELIVPFYARLLFMCQQFSPTLGDWLLARFQKRS